MFHALYHLFDLDAGLIKKVNRSFSSISINNLHTYGLYYDTVDCIFQVTGWSRAVQKSRRVDSGQQCLR